MSLHLLPIALLGVVVAAVSLHDQSPHLRKIADRMGQIQSRRRNCIHLVPVAVLIVVVVVVVVVSLDGLSLTQQRILRGSKMVMSSLSAEKVAVAV